MNMASASHSRGKIDSGIHEQTPAAASYYRHVTQKFHGNRIFISRMLNRNPKRLSAISTQSSSAHVEERDQELWGTLEQGLSLIGFSKKQ